jgi:hypothetical protein
VYPDIWLTYDFYLRRPGGELGRAHVERLRAGSARGAMSKKSWIKFRPQAHPAWHVIVVRRVADDELADLGGGGV